MIFSCLVLSKSLKGVRNASTHTAEILSIAKLTRNVEEKCLNRIEKKDFKASDLNLHRKSPLLQRLRRKTTNTQLKSPEPNVLSYIEPKLNHKMKKLALRTNSIKSLIKENIKNVFSELKIQEKKKEQVIKISERYINHDKYNITQKNSTQKIRKGQLKNKDVKTTHINKLNRSIHAYEIENQEKPFTEAIIKKYIERTLVPWKPSLVSINDLKPYMPIWLEFSSNIIRNLKSENLILNNKQETNEKAENNPDFWSTFSMNDLTFYAKQYIYKNPSIKLNQKKGMLKTISEIIERKRSICM
ncbi:hypothetical protein PMAC_002447 [Pneumocystis sp. 'macacae']|nr:hypothetical protein PMAC_002447 [Pneumocystis sp. 'macacae']